MFVRVCTHVNGAVSLDEELLLSGTERSQRSSEGQLFRAQPTVHMDMYVNEQQRENESASLLLNKGTRSGQSRTQGVSSRRITVSLLAKHS